AAVIALAVALVAAAFVLSPRDPAGADVMDEDVLRGTNVAPALQAYVEGEAAFRAGRLEEAHSRFSAATVLDSGFTFAWYRRAVAAEWTHRTADADRSIARALRDEERLSERGQLLLRAYSAWRAGDAPAAEAYYRRLLTSDASDLEAWFQFAEIAYHAGPLHGRPLDAARDPWDRVVALDSGNLAALTHAIRLEARAGDTAAIRALSRSLDAIGAEGPVALESRVTAAYGMGGEEIAAVQPVLDSLPDYSLSFLHGIVASFLEQPAAAVPIARRLTAASRPDVVRGHGHEALAHLALAQGRWREAQAELDRAAQIDRAGAAWTRAYFATLPFLSLPSAAIDAAADGLAAAPPAPTTAPLYLELSVEAQAAPVIHGYLAELLRLSGAGSARDPSPEDLVLGPDAHPSTRELRLDLQRGLRAEREQRAGRAIRALAELDSMGMRVPYQFAGRSVFFARTRERYLRAELLFRAGRLDEADAAFAAVPHGSRSDYIYLAPVHLRRGQIQERRGDRPAAAAHYRRVLTLLAHPDPEFAALRNAADAGLRRVADPSTSDEVSIGPRS
ncbi:MAG TPA: hypothetical protein VFI96_02480, partial [Longimicrobiaceae bacterium]|nr:hypothetical protein [Longimicrobiaceae bacterium]